MEKLTRLSSEDCFIMEIVANRINAIMDEVEGIEGELHGRIDSLWKYLRIKKEEQDKRLQAIEKSLGVKNSKEVESETSANSENQKVSKM